LFFDIFFGALFAGFVFVVDFVIFGLGVEGGDGGTVDIFDYLG
jgi:hypothetical protein